MTARAPLVAVLAVTGALAAPQAAQSATVTTMVAGKSGLLRAAKPVRIMEKRRVKVGGRRCAVAGATPLGILAGTGLPLRIRDYGRCGRRIADAGSLFVTRIGFERNRGRDGWVYKAGRIVSSAGAGDRSGRRLRGGDRLLWFYCRQRAGGCQRTLEALPDRTAAAPGEVVRVRVRGYDDQGRGIPVGGATVRLGTAEATTGPDGTAELAVPAPGRLALTAERPGMVAAFPGEVRAG
jgi:hypothetical protein